MGPVLQEMDMGVYRHGQDEQEVFIRVAVTGDAWNYHSILRDVMDADSEWLSRCPNPRQATGNLR